MSNGLFSLVNRVLHPALPAPAPKPLSKPLNDALSAATTARAQSQQAQAAVAQARQQQSTLEQQLATLRRTLQANASDLAGKPGGIDGSPQVSALKQQIDQATAKVSLLQADAVNKGNAALASEKIANKLFAASGQPVPFAAANQVNDAFQAGTLSAQDQSDLLGGSLQLDDSQRGQGDALKVQTALQRGGPVQAAELLKNLVQGGDADYGRSLIAATGPQISAMAKGLGPPLSADDQSRLAASLNDVRNAAGAGTPAQASFDAQVNAGAGADGVTRLTGGAVRGVALRDADAIRARLQNDPAGAAQLLADDLTQNTDPAYRQNLLEVGKDVLTRFGQRLAGQPQKLDDATRDALSEGLTKATEALPPDQQKALASAVAEGIPDTSNGLGIDHDGPGIGLKRAIANGDGTSFAINLGNALNEAGKTKVGDDAFRLTAEGIDEAKADFDTAATNYSHAMDNLKAYQQDFGAALGPDGLAKGTQKFLDDNKAVIDAFNEKGTKLASMMAGIQSFDTEKATGGNAAKLKDSFINASDDLPALSQTPGGSQVLNGLMFPKEAVAGEQPPFLEKTGELLEKTEKGTKQLAKLANTFVSQTTQNLATLAKAGDVDGAQKLIEGLGNEAKLLGIPQEKLADVQKSLSDYSKLSADVLRGTASPDELQTKMDALEKKSGELKALAPNSALGDALKGLNVVTSGIAVFNGVKNWDDASIQERFKTVKSAASGLQETGELLSGFLEKAGMADGAEMAEAFAGKLGPVGGAITAITSGIDAFQSFQDGDVVGGVSNTLLAAGGVATVIPGGQGVGTLLLGSGMVLKLGANLFGSGQLDTDRSQLSDFLKAGGVDPTLANNLVVDNRVGKISMGQFVEQYARHLNLAPDQLLQTLSKLSPSRQQQVITLGQGMRPGADGQIVDGPSDPFNANRNIQTDTALQGEILSNSAAAQTFQEMDFFLKDQGVLDPSGQFSAAALAGQ